MKLCFPVLQEGELLAILASLDISYDFQDPNAYSVYARILTLLNVPDSSSALETPAAQAAEHTFSCAVTRVCRQMAMIIAIASKKALSFTIYDIVDARPARTRIFLSAVFNFVRYQEFYRKLIKEMHASRQDRFAMLQMLAKERRILLERFNQRYFQFMDSKPLIEKVNQALAEAKAEVAKTAERYRELNTQHAELTARKNALERQASEIYRLTDQALYELRIVAPGQRSLGQQYQFSILRAQNECRTCKSSIQQLSERIDQQLQNHNIMREIYRAVQANKQQKAELARLQKMIPDAQVYRLEADVQKMRARLQELGGSADQEPNSGIDEKPADNAAEARPDFVFDDQADEDTAAAIRSAVEGLESSLAEEEETKRALEIKRKAVQLKAEQLQSQACERFNEYYRLFIAQMQASERLFFDFLEQEKKSMQSRK